MGNFLRGVVLGFLLVHGFCAVASVGMSLQVESFSWEQGKGRLNLVINIDDGWKMCGPSGPTDALVYPPEIFWERSENLDLETLRVHWPTPTVFRSTEGFAHVYTKKLKIPIDFSAQAAGQKNCSARADSMLDLSRIMRAC